MAAYRIFKSPHKGVGWEIDHVIDDDLTLHVGKARTLLGAISRVRRDARYVAPADEEVTLLVPVADPSGAPRKVRAAILSAAPGRRRGRGQTNR